MKCKRCLCENLKTINLEGHRFLACGNPDCGKPLKKITLQKHYSLTAVKAEAEEYFRQGHNRTNIYRHYEKLLYDKDFTKIVQHLERLVKHNAKLGLGKIVQEVIESKLS